MKAKKVSPKPPAIPDRQKTHGHWELQSIMDEAIMQTFHAAPNFSRLTPSQKSALRMISTKLSRILVGDANHQDHWADIAGYCERVIES